MKPRRRWSFFWAIPLAAAAAAGWFFYRQSAEQGASIVIRFEEASGISAGKTPIRLRGVDVGRVRDVRLSEDREEAVVGASLFGQFEGLNRSGAQFWVVRPRISGDEISGLSTIASQPYIAMRAGDGETNQTEFAGLSEPPAIKPEAEAPDGLALRLIAPQRWGLKEGGAVLYRGIQVGAIRKVQLADQGWAVVSDVLIHRPFVPLVRMDSKFWKTSGIKFDAGLFKGVEFELGNLSSLVSGGVSFATPERQSPPAPPGAAFRLHEETQEEWMQWAPHFELAPSEELAETPGTNGEGDSAEGAPNPRTDRTPQAPRSP